MYLFCHSVKNVLLVDICLKGAIKMGESGASLVVQGLRIYLPMQGTQVQDLVREDPTCRGANKSMRHNY